MESLSRTGDHMIDIKWYIDIKWPVVLVTQIDVLVRVIECKILIPHQVTLVPLQMPSKSDRHLYKQWPTGLCWSYPTHTYTKLCDTSMQLFLISTHLQNETRTTHIAALEMFTHLLAFLVILKAKLFNQWVEIFWYALLNR